MAARECHLDHVFDNDAGNLDDHREALVDNNDHLEKHLDNKQQQHIDVIGVAGVNGANLRVNVEVLCCRSNSNQI